MHPARFPYQKPPRGMRLNCNHMLARGLVAAWVFNELTGSVAVDLVEANRGIFDSSHPPAWGSGIKGALIDFTDSSYTGIKSASPPRIVPSCVAVGVAFGSSTDSNTGIAHAKVGSATNHCLLATATDGHRFSIVPNELSSAGRMTDNTFAAGEYHNVVGLRNSLKVFVDAAEESVSADTNNYTSVDDDCFTFGSRQSGYGFRGFRGLLYYVYFWDRELTEAEIRSLHRNPYQFFESQLRSKYFTVDAGGNTGNGEGTLTLGGSVTRRQFLNRPATGVLNFSGSSTFSLGLIQEAIAGVLTAAGTLTRKYIAHRPISGAISPTGALTQWIRFIRYPAGTLQPTGAATRKIKYFRNIAGSVALVGTVAYVSGQLIAGVLALAGALTARAIFRRSVGGEMSPSGNGQKTHGAFYRLVEGFLTPLGAVPIGNVLKRGLLRLGKALNLR